MIGKTLGNHETVGPASVTVGPPNTAVVRQLINAAFDDEEIVALCFDYFRFVYDSLGSEMGKRKKIQVLLEECDQRNQMDELLKVVEQLNPAQYELFAPRLYAPAYAPAAGISAEPKPSAVRLEVAPPPQPGLLPKVAGFVGRETELARFADKLATGHLAVITGMPGIGKTWLAATLARRTCDLGKIFWHTFHRDEGIAAIIWELAGFLAWHGQADLWNMLQSAQQTGGQPPPPEVLFDYLSQMLRGPGYLLCLDDLHYVDDDPLLDQFVERICQPCRASVASGDPAIIIATQVRPRFVEADQFPALGGLSLEDTLRFMASHGYPVPDAQTLEAQTYDTSALLKAEKLMSADLAATLHARTGGNPLFLTQIVDALRQTAAPARFILRLSEEEDIERFLAQEIDGSLTEQERAVMSAVAVLMGQAGTSDAIEAILGAEAENVRRTLSDLRQRCLLNASQGKSGREYSMNAVVRHYYYALLSKSERQTMHRRAGDYYTTEEPDALRAARHFSEIGEYARAAELATRDAWALINQGQARPLRQLLEGFTADQLSAEQWLSVNLALGDVYAAQRASPLARERFGAADALLAALPDSPQVRECKARVCRAMGALLEPESPQAALEWLQRGLNELQGDSALEEAVLHIRIGSVEIGQGNYAEARLALNEGLARLPAGSDHWRAAALNNLGLVYAHQGDRTAGKASHLHALELYQQCGDHWGVISAHVNLGILAEGAGEWADAEREYRQALELAEKLGAARHRANLELNMGSLTLKQGNDQAAEGHLTQCIQLARQYNLHEHRVYAQSTLADLWVRQRRWDAAEAGLQEAEQLAAQKGFKFIQLEISRSWAQVRIGQRRAAEGRALAERAVNLAREMGLATEEGSGLRVLGQALMADGQTGPALEAFERSLALLADRDPYEAARTQAEWGACLLRAGEAGRAQLLVQQAGAVFLRLGAQRDLANVQGHLA